MVYHCFSFVVLCHGFIIFQCSFLVSWVYHCFSVVVLCHGFSIVLVWLSCVMGLSLF